MRVTGVRPISCHSRVRAFWIAGIASAGVFAALLLIRLDVYERLFARPRTVSAQTSGLTARESWMNIFQSNRKIGFSFKRLVPKPPGYQLEERLVMRINTMGMVQDLQLHTLADLHADLSLERFRFDIASGRFRFSTRGEAAAGVLTLQTESAGARRTAEIPLTAKPYLPAAVVEMLAAEDLTPGSRYRFDIFDPASMAQAPVQAEVIDREELDVAGGRVPATRISMSLRGMTQTAWIAPNGDLLRERGLLGMRLEKATRDEALQGLEAAAGEDMTEIASVATNREIPDPAALKRLRVRIGGIRTEDLQLQGGRQRFEDGVLVVHRENLEDLPEMPREDRMNALERIFLKPEALIQSDHERIRDLVRTILEESPPATPLAAARLLLQWIHRHIEKRPVLSLPDALSTLQHRMGDCNEHAMLLAAMARAAGIPARVEAGLVYMRGRFYYHAWNLLFLGRWVTADALFDQLPADVTHLRLVTGSVQQQLDLAGVIGNITLEVLD
jgi:hypothetical protein